jgi:hypothetical protein
MEGFSTSKCNGPLDFITLKKYTRAFIKRITVRNFQHCEKKTFMVSWKSFCTIFQNVIFLVCFIIYFIFTFFCQCFYFYFFHLSCGLRIAQVSVRQEDLSFRENEVCAREMPSRDPYKVDERFFVLAFTFI